MSGKRTVDDAELIENEPSSLKRRKLNPNRNDPNSSLDSMEEKQANDESIGIASISDKIISLQVGERKYTTRISTLTKYENCYFTSLFAGNFASNTSHNESIFIDRDGDIFYFVLQYLRSGTLIISSNENSTDTLLILKKLLIEAQFYMIQHLVKYIESQLPKPVTPPRQYLPGSQILSLYEQEKIQNILNEYEWDFIWEQKISATGRYTMQLQTYYKENGERPTIILCEDTAGNVFAISSTVGICSLSDLFPNGYNLHSELMEKQQEHATYFNIRDMENKIPPFTLLAEFNELISGYRIRHGEKHMCFGCYKTRNKKHCRTKHVLLVKICNNLKAAGKRAITVKGDNDVFSDEGNFMYSEFVTARIEVFVKTDNYYYYGDEEESVESDS